MYQLSEICAFLDGFAPCSLAEEWDNVGLLLGDETAEVRRVMTCLTVTPASVAEAVDRQADLVVSHHPMPFRPLRRITTDTTVGRLLWSLASHRVAVYSPHTALDSAPLGINQQWAERLELVDIEPLFPPESAAEAPAGGKGRIGTLAEPISLSEVAERIKRLWQLDRIGVVGPPDRRVRRIAVGCGSAGDFLSAAAAAEADLFITGETNFHTCLEAEALGLGLLLTSHFASERFALEVLAQHLTRRFPELTIWASERERNPLTWL